MIMKHIVGLLGHICRVDNKYLIKIVIFGTVDELKVKLADPTLNGAPS